MKALGVIGGGAMGSAIIKGLLEKGVLAGADIFVVESDVKRQEQLQQTLGVQIVSSPPALAGKCQIILLAVKPQVVGEVLDQLGTVVGAEHLVISIAAGITLNYLESRLPAARIIRVMPNTPARFGRGISAYASGSRVEHGDLAQAEEILGAVGKYLMVKEAQLDAVTAVSGSGPAYVFKFAEAMIEAGVMLGLSYDQARLLVTETLAGSVEMLCQSMEHPARLRNEVTSPAGTTAAALYQLEQGSFNGLVMKALQAAAQRSAELGEGAKQKA